MDAEYLDLLGRQLGIGNRVAYATVNYKRAVQRTGIIVEMCGQYIRVKGDKTSRTSLQVPSKVVLVS